MNKMLSILLIEVYMVHKILQVPNREYIFQLTFICKYIYIY